SFLVGQQPGSILEDTLSGRAVPVVVVITTVCICLPDVDDRMRERLTRVVCPHPPANEQDGARFQRRRDLRPVRRTLPIKRAEDVVFGGLPVRSGDGLGGRGFLLGKVLAVAAEVA